MAVKDRNKSIEEILAGGRHVMSNLDHTGDTRTTWAPGSVEETAAAKEIFDRLMVEGCFAYKVDTTVDPNTSGEQIKEFDPHAQQIVVTRPLQGG